MWFESTRRCSRTVLVQQRGRLLASVAGNSGLAVLHFIVNFDSRKSLDTEIFEREKWLAADKEIGSLKLAVE